MYIDVATKTTQKKIETKNINKLFLLLINQKNIIKDNNICLIVPIVPFKESKNQMKIQYSK